MLEKRLAEEIDEMIDNAYRKGYEDGYAKASAWKDQIVYFVYDGENEESYRLKAMFDDWNSLIDFIREEVCMGAIKINCDIRPIVDENEGTDIDFLNMILKNIHIDTYHISTRTFNE